MITEPGPRTGADDVTQPIPRVRPRRWFRLNWITALVVVWAGLAACNLQGGLPGAVSELARAGPVTHRHAERAVPATFPPAVTTPTTIPWRELTPVSAAAFNPYASGHAGDHGDLAYRAIDRNPATAWQTDWYVTPTLGGLYPGTGLLVDMGQTRTIATVLIRLGPAHAATFQVRVGSAPTLADLPPVATVAHAGGIARVRLASPTHGRYVLIWFTKLPADPGGTFQASVYNVGLLGRLDHSPVRRNRTTQPH